MLIQSSFGFNADMGKLTAITIVAAMFLDLLLLPALLLAVDTRKAKQRVENLEPAIETLS